MSSTLARRPLVIVTVVLATLAALATAMLTGTPEANAATGCQVTYVNSQWTGGFTASVQVTAADAHNGWTVTWTWPSGQQVTSAWSATVSQSGSVVTATNLSYDSQIAAGGSVSFGIQGTWTTANDVSWLGKTGALQAASFNTMTDPLDRIAASVESDYFRYYVVSYCSPARSGSRQLRLEVTNTDEAGGKRTGSYATAFEADYCLS